ncbi:unnamed protein product [Schistosoma curassoni]|uniref:PLD phosphodiesterase domain-containing protein n=1 Tax=Schistosoma curassoni TaxID=6186 RepID=A0A183L0M6_9TREM|nr:unnamed protein product [Schistosoma curassoni]
MNFKGSNILKKLVDRGKEVDLKIAQNGKETNSTDLMNLTESGAQIRWLDFHRLVGQGVLHTKLWSVDAKNGYVGSANMDWRSLTQSSPSLFNPPGRNDDLDALLSVINAAEKFIYISVMNFLPEVISYDKNIHSQ